MTCIGGLTQAAGRLALAGLFCFLQIACASPGRSAATSDADASAAQALASAAYKRSVGDQVQHFNCHLAEETVENWIFVCKSLDATPRPDANAMVLVKKAGRFVEVVHG